MVNLLRKLFIKDYQDISNQKVREKHGILAAIVGMVSNFLLAGIKILIGVIVSSITIITDALNNLTDMASCIVNLIGFKLAGKPADKEHPFGHERIEYIAGLIIAFVIIALAVVLGYTSVMKIIYPPKDQVYELKDFIIAVVILVIAILVKLWQGFFYKKIGKIINSISLQASSQDSINDVISTSVVLLATVLEYCLQKYDIHLDGYFGIAVALYIAISGIKLVIDTSNPLIGIKPDSELIKKIISDICSYENVLGIHDVMCHSYGPTKIYMTCHVEVDRNVDVMASHDLIDNIEVEIGKKHNVILTIHMDPVDTTSELVVTIKKQVTEIVKEISPELTFHDFRIVAGPTHTNVLFDVVVPFDSKLKCDECERLIKTKICNLNKKYNPVIKIDRDYVN